jgi:hypothetical protein
MAKIFSIKNVKLFRQDKIQIYKNHNRFIFKFNKLSIRDNCIVEFLGSYDNMNFYNLDMNRGKYKKKYKPYYYKFYKTGNFELTKEIITPYILINFYHSHPTHRVIVDIICA